MVLNLERPETFKKRGYFSFHLSLFQTEMATCLDATKVSARSSIKILALVKCLRRNLYFQQEMAITQIMWPARVCSAEEEWSTLRIFFLYSLTLPYLLLWAETWCESKDPHNPQFYSQAPFSFWLCDFFINITNHDMHLFIWTKYSTQVGYNVIFPLILIRYLQIQLSFQSLF